jgi:hypothetical protein
MATGSINGNGNAASLGGPISAGGGLDRLNSALRQEAKDRKLPVMPSAKPQAKPKPTSGEVRTDSKQAPNGTQTGSVTLTGQGGINAAATVRVPGQTLTPESTTVGIKGTLPLIPGLAGIVNYNPLNNRASGGVSFEATARSGQKIEGSVTTDGKAPTLQISVSQNDIKFGVNLTQGKSGFTIGKEF